jgi:hypothetical protein
MVNGVNLSDEFLFHFYRGSELLSEGFAAEARAEFERALALRPGDAETLASLDRSRALEAAAPHSGRVPQADRRWTTTTELRSSEPRSDELSPGDPRGSVPPPASTVTRDSVLPLPTAGAHLHGQALATVRVDGEFRARLNHVRGLLSDGKAFEIEPAYRRGRHTVHPSGSARFDDPDATPALGGIRGRGHVVLGSSAGHQLLAMRLSGEPFYVRETLLVGYDVALASQLGRLVRSDGDHHAMVQLVGTGAVLVEVRGNVQSLVVKPDQEACLSPESVVGWTGRLLPRLPEDGSLVGLPGFVRFSGDGHLLVELLP